jgi:hypothetical protein
MGNGDGDVYINPSQQTQLYHTLANGSLLGSMLTGHELKSAENRDV